MNKPGRIGARAPRPRIGADPVGQLVNEIDSGDRVRFPLADLEDSLHRLAPSQQNLAVGFGKFRVLGDEDLHHGATVGKRTLQGEIVKQVGEFSLIGESAGDALATT